MWITVVLVLLTVIFPSNTQEVTNFATQTVTETTQPNQGVKWDSTGPPVTISIRQGRTNSVQRPQDEVSSQRLHYSNQWQPYLIPIGLNNFGDERRRASGEDNANLQFAPTLLRRPDSDLSRISSVQQNYSDYSLQVPPAPMPMPPVSPMFFYPPQLNYFGTRNSYALGGSSLSQNTTAETTRASSAEASIRDFSRDIGPFYGSIPDVPERYHPFNIQRFGNGFMSSQAFSAPYILPNTNENILHPLLYPYAGSHIYDRETGPEVIETIAEGPTTLQRETPSTSDIEDHENDAVNGTPSDSASTFIPPERFPLPIRAFPFGVLPPPFLHPMLPNAVGLGDVPLGPLVQPPNLPKESLITDSIVPQASISTNLPVETPPNVLPPVDTVLPEVVGAAAIDSTPEATIAEEKPSSEKIPYEFGFDMNDGKGNDQHRKEESDLHGTVRGSYGYRDTFGVYRLVNYIADKDGFRAVVKSNEPGVANSGSADVIVLAEQPPPQAIAEGQKPQAIIVPEASTDLIAEGSVTGSR